LKKTNFIDIIPVKNFSLLQLIFSVYTYTIKHNPDTISIIQIQKNKSNTNTKHTKARQKHNNKQGHIHNKQKNNKYQENIKKTGQEYSNISHTMQAGTLNR